MILVDGDALTDVRVLQDAARIKLVVRAGTVARDLTSAPALVAA